MLVNDKINHNLKRKSNDPTSIMKGAIKAESYLILSVPLEPEE